MFFKYLINLIFLFLGLIWISQTLRIIDIKYSISNQLLDILSSSLFVLPSYLNPLLPILIIFSYILFNYKLTSSNEMIIINQYFNQKSKVLFQFIISFFIFIFYILNNEIISPLTYQTYKEKELEIRNNLKLGVPANNEFHIENDLSIFFKESEKNTFYKVEAIIFENNQFIISDRLNIEYTDNGYNIVFLNGYRIQMSNLEISKTIFKKFVYNLKNKSPDKLSFDKEHFNTFQLLKMKKEDFRIYGHNRVVHYFLLVLTLFLLNDVVFKNSRNKNEKLFRFNLVFLVIIFYLANSYFQYLLLLNQIEIIIYYISLTILALIMIIIIKFKKT